MAKKVINRKPIPNIFAGGGVLGNSPIATNFAATGGNGMMMQNSFNNAVQNTMNNTALPQADNSSGGGGNNGGGANMAGIGSAIGAGASMIGNMVTDISDNKAKQQANDYVKELKAKTTADINNMSGLSNNDSLMNAFGSYRDQEALKLEKKSAGASIGGALATGGAGAAAGAAFGPIGAGVGAAVGVLTSAIGSIFQGAQRRKGQRKINRATNEANELRKTNLSHQIGKVNTRNNMSMDSNFFAEGGFMPMTSMAIGYDFTNESLANKRLDALAKNKLTSMPNYADSESIFENGGNLNSYVPNYQQHGGDFSNGVDVIAAGGTHENNPYGGVMMGMDAQGTPNLVEEGEVKYSDYMFSDRLTLDRVDVVRHKLKNKYIGKTFAEAAKDMSEESSERPNDPISLNGLGVGMGRLMAAQEDVKALQNDGATNQFAFGGPMMNDNATPYFIDDLIDYQIPVVSSTPVVSAEPQINTPMGIVSTSPGNIAIASPEQSIGDAYIDANNAEIRKKKRQNFATQVMRNAPIFGSALGVALDGFSATNREDYTHADSVNNPNSYRAVSASNVGNYLAYKPLDRNYYLNRQQASTAATKRELRDAAGGNRGALISALTGVDYTGNLASAELARQAEEYNLNQRMQVEQFNRGTNMFNTEMGLQADMANQQAIQRDAEMTMRAEMARANMRDVVDARAAAGRAANLTNLFDNMGAVGRERISMNMVNNNPGLYYSIDNNGNVIYKGAYNSLPEEDKKIIREHAEEAKSGSKKKYGGSLKSKGITYKW